MRMFTMSHAFNSTWFISIVDGLGNVEINWRMSKKLSIFLI